LKRNFFSSIENRTKNKDLEIKKKINGTIYLKRVTTCLQGVLSKSITIPQKSLRSKSFLASKRVKIRLSKNNIDIFKNQTQILQNNPIKTERLYVNMIGNGGTKKLTEGPPEFDEKTGKMCLTTNEEKLEQIVKKHNISEIITRTVQIQRFVRKYLARKKLSQISCKIFDKEKLKKELKNNAENYRKNYLTFFSKKNTKITNKSSKLHKDVWSERAELIRKKTKLFQAIKQNLPINSANIFDECKEAINCKDNRGNTPLFYLVKLNRILLTELLLSKGAEINAKNENGNTVLHLAMIMENAEIASILIKNGANLYEKNNMGQTPVMLAKGYLLKKLNLDL